MPMAVTYVCVRGVGGRTVSQNSINIIFTGPETQRRGRLGEDLRIYRKEMQRSSFHTELARPVAPVQLTHTLLPPAAWVILHPLQNN
jgi:hypothetical protein